MMSHQPHTERGGKDAEGEAVKRRKLHDEREQREKIEQQLAATAWKKN